MIVRISGEGQYELDDQESVQLERLDADLTEALHAKNDERFHSLLRDTIAFVHKAGSPVGEVQIVPSLVIIPPADVTLEEATKFFDDDSEYDQPLPA